MSWQYYWIHNFSSFVLQYCHFSNISLHLFILLELQIRPLLYFFVLYSCNYYHYVHLVHFCYISWSLRHFQTGTHILLKLLFPCWINNHKLELEIEVFNHLEICQTWDKFSNSYIRSMRSISPCAVWTNKGHRGRFLWLWRQEINSESICGILGENQK